MQKFEFFDWDEEEVKAITRYLEGIGVLDEYNYFENSLGLFSGWFEFNSGAGITADLLIKLRDDLVELR